MNTKITRIKIRISSYVFSCLFAGASALLASNAYGGVKEVSGGAESYSYVEGSAWFVGPIRKVNACIEISKDFEKVVSRERAKQSILSAYSTWANYIKEKGVARLEGDQRLPTDIEIASTCGGKEDLTFKFGVVDKDVKAHMGRYKKPVSFAALETYDLKSTWGKGFIWVAPQGSLGKDEDLQRPIPDWSLPYTVEGILLHEIGHVLGNSHVEGTVMTADFARYLKGNPSDFGKQVLTSVDFRKELHVCIKCDFQQEGLLGNNETVLPSGHTQREENFKLLTGRLPVGTVHAKFQVRNEKSYLVVEDSKDQSSFELTPKKGRFYTSTWGSDTFKIAWQKPLSGLGSAYSSSGIMLSMTLTTVPGKKIPVRVGRNMGGYSFNEPIGNGVVRGVQTDLIHLIHEDLEENIILFGATYRGTPNGGPL
jgi:hypothetical protein